jgi:hypothetical protein
MGTLWSTRKTICAGDEASRLAIVLRRRAAAVRSSWGRGPAMIHASFVRHGW